LVSIGIVTINASQVGNFGEFEYWFALIKVVAIVAFIIVGVLLITGLGPWQAVGFSNLGKGPLRSRHRSAVRC
jgi:GABA permease